MRRATLAGAIVAPPLPAFYIDAPSADASWTPTASAPRACWGFRPAATSFGGREPARRQPRDAARDGERPTGRPPVSPDDARDDQVLAHALRAALRAAFGLPRGGRLAAAGTLVKILLAMVGARSAAMAHNRLADRALDARQPADRVAGSSLRARFRSASCAFPRRLGGALPRRRGEPEPPDAPAVAGRAGAARPLLVHETLHGAFPPRARALPCPGARRRLDRRPRARSRRCRSCSGWPSSSGRRDSTCSTRFRTRRTTGASGSTRFPRASAPGARSGSRRRFTPRC